MACTRTYAGLCIYSPSIAPDQISTQLGIPFTRHFDRDLTSPRKANRDHNFWLWSTQEFVSSTDNLDHLSAIFSQLDGKESVLNDLRSAGCTTSISCYWGSDGQGGPSLTAEAIQSLARFGLDIWWDVYFDSDPTWSGA